jgi:uncharacterized SAM-binding protein YcdF (DUF218 family)
VSSLFAFLIEVAKTLISLPALFFVLALAGALLAWRNKRAGFVFLGVSGLCAYLLCCPFIGAHLLRAAQTSPALSQDLKRDELRARADAIVVIAAGHNSAASEYGGGGVDPLTLERLRYAAALARRSGLPILTSGGVPARGEPPLAESMRAILVDEWRCTVPWTETGSRDTRGNAQGSAAILGPAGIERVFLVTHAWHMPRALGAFRSAGLEPVAAPTGFRGRPQVELRTFWPSAKGLHESAWAWHEALGGLWYWLKS